MYWRTAGNKEVDFVIEAADGSLVAIEVKTTTRPTTKPLDGMRQFLNDYRDRARGGLVVHGGDEIFWIGEGVLAVPWWRVM
jgi:predicted AAA+ superfamily ATPase